MPRFGCFFAKSPKGGISDPKNFTADLFVFKTVYFGRKFWKKCPKRGERGGASELRNVTDMVDKSV